MKRDATIDGKKVTFKTHGAIPIFYAQEYGRDFFAVMMELEAVFNGKIDANTINLIPLYEMAHLMAKTADKNVPDDLTTWLMEFEEFPIMDVFEEIQDLIFSNMKSLKEKK